MADLTIPKELVTALRETADEVRFAMKWLSEEQAKAKAATSPASLRSWADRLEDAERGVSEARSQHDRAREALIAFVLKEVSDAR